MTFLTFIYDIHGVLANYLKKQIGPLGRLTKHVLQADWKHQPAASFNVSILDSH